MGDGRLRRAQATHNDIRSLAATLAISRDLPFNSLTTFAAAIAEAPAFQPTGGRDPRGVTVSLCHLVSSYQQFMLGTCLVTLRT
jgi:hypothetical protein